MTLVGGGLTLKTLHGLNWDWLMALITCVHRTMRGGEQFGTYHNFKADFSTSQFSLYSGCLEDAPVCTWEYDVRCIDIKSLVMCGFCYSGPHVKS